MRNHPFLGAGCAEQRPTIVSICLHIVVIIAQMQRRAKSSSKLSFSKIACLGPSVSRSPHRVEF
jgi:hypothetical protein